jgi:hypothetical protein
VKAKAVRVRLMTGEVQVLLDLDCEIGVVH